MSGTTKPLASGATSLLLKPPRLGSLEFGRFLAATLVVLSHVLHEMAHYASNPRDIAFFTDIPLPGNVGVDYFFVLSGFVMLTAHHGDFGHWRAPAKFWWRRACRIYPMYFIGLAIILYYFHYGLTARYLFDMLTLLPVDVASEAVSPAWSLRYEMAFYVMFGLCLLPRLGWVVLGLWVLATIYRAIPGVPLLLHGDGEKFFSVWSLFFFCGLAGGWAYLHVTRDHLWRWLLWPGAAAAALWSGVIIWRLVCAGNLTTTALDMPLAPAFAAIITGLAGLERAGQLRFGAWAFRLGAISYPLYILHQPIVVLISVHFYLWAKFGSLDLYGFLAAWLSLIFIGAAFAGLCLDLPLQRRLRRIF